MPEHETIVERSIERAVREHLREVGDYWSGDREERERIEQEVRESLIRRRREDEV